MQSWIFPALLDFDPKNACRYLLAAALSCLCSCPPCSLPYLCVHAQVNQLTMTHDLRVDLGEVLASRNIRKFDAALMLPLYGYKVRCRSLLSIAMVLWMVHICHLPVPVSCQICVETWLPSWESSYMQACVHVLSYLNSLCCVMILSPCAGY